MTALNIVLIVLVFLVAFLGFFLNYVGFFTKIIIKEKIIGPFTLVYREHIGDYKKTGAIQNELYHSLIDKHKIVTYKGFGIYYDNPKNVPEHKLRSLVGCILEAKDSDKVELLKDDGFLIKEMPSQNSITVEFPFENSLSIIAGVIKVYPKFNKYIEQNNIEQKEMMEIYDVPNKKIVYLMAK